MTEQQSQQPVALVPAGHSKPIGRYSPGVALSLPLAGKLVFVSGQVATDQHGNVLSPGDAGGQTRVVFERIRGVLRAAGGDLPDIVNLVVYVADVKRDFTEISTVRNEMLGEPAPASTLVEVSRLAEEGCLVEISAIAVVGG
ncbi:enamine deaminase RidA [Longimycelium tulufanense]|uniref:Enamine deaminase RidA n=1 Tax=Longimycelium tulufanense TaxID=907463 RepID=A0A8J3FVT8_9PSEU|nr:RidA family protein [Longimycelium tulufanense]GGM53933.1 enamine deaminase RidA [Longimycelium tulufanense]